MSESLMTLPRKRKAKRNPRAYRCGDFGTRKTALL
jgi:hypothetical protein